MEENNSILLNLCSQRNFGEIFAKFPNGAAFISPDYSILWCNDSFKKMAAKTKILSSIKLPSYKEGAQSLYIENEETKGFLQFLPIIYHNQFLGYSVIFMPGEKGKGPDLNKLNAAKHDLNNLLTIVLNLITHTGKAEMVSQGLTLTKDFLNGLSLDKGGAEEKLYAYDALSLIYHTYKDSCGGKIAFKANIPSNLYPVKINKAKFIRVISNLITNAVEAVQPDGVITLSAFNLNENGKDYICVCVADNGKGIPEEYLKSIFNKDFSTKERGSGLGLSIVKSIMDEMNGIIEVQNRLNEGAKFILKFPALLRNKKQIAIIEDEEMLNEVLTSQFSDDYTVFSFNDAESFLKQASKLPVRLAIIDKKLPGINGMECIKRLRIIDNKVKIILASGSDLNDDKNEDQAEIDKFVKKPYDFDQLFSAVEELLA
jgi:CheY-like chemotaxis protein